MTFRRWTAWVRPKSKGIRVTRRAYRFIRRGDAARSRADWGNAVRNYGDALAISPDLQHIWMQYGNALKEDRRFSDAILAYRRAATLVEEDPEPLMMLGHLAKRLGDPLAAQYFVAALRRDRTSLATAAELIILLCDTIITDRALLDEALGLLGVSRIAVESARVDSAPPDGTLFVDVSDLLAYLSRARIPTGIQRVQMEVSRHLAGMSDGGEVALCCYSAGRRGWVLVPDAQFHALCEASLGGDAEAWRSSIAFLYGTISVSERLGFPEKATLLNPGSSWADRNFLLDVRTMRRETGLTFVSVVYDLIPIHHPQWFVASLVEDYKSWFRSLTGTADGYVAISQATCRDLLADAPGITPDMVRVVPINGDFTIVSPSHLPATALGKFGLADGSYVLLVSTLEPRKNHVNAFAAWLKLASEIGIARLPQLVCVGGKGWLNDDLHAMLRKHRSLQKKVSLLSGVLDSELDLLYRHSLFTLYPSLYEGWGLPVSESLSQGKIPAISSNSALPEAGGRFAVYFDPTDVADIAASVKPLILDADARQARADAIRSDFSSRQWPEIALDFSKAARHFADGPSSRNVPVAKTGTLYSLATFGSDARHDLCDGEMFRIGRNWRSPAAEGCGLSGEAGLHMRTADDSPLRLRVLMQAQDHDCRYAIRVDRHETTGTSSPGAPQWIDVDLAVSGGDLDIEIVPQRPDALVIAGFMLTRAMPPVA
jgi:glycosyltransferase involved in cell wall biosynthesis